MAFALGRDHRGMQTFPTRSRHFFLLSVLAMLERLAQRRRAGRLTR